MESVDFVAIGEGVAVGVGQERVGVVGVFGQVREAVGVGIEGGIGGGERVQTVGDLPCVGQAVGVGVGVGRIGAELIFLDVREAFSVGVGGSGLSEVAEVLKLPGVRQGVAVQTEAGRLVRADRKGVHSPALAL